MSDCEVLNRSLTSMDWLPKLNAREASGFSSCCQDDGDHDHDRDACATVVDKMDTEDADRNNGDASEPTVNLDPNGKPPYR